MGNVLSGPESTPALPVDPNLASETANAATEQFTALQTQAQGDTAQIMAQYGTRLAMAGSIAPTLTTAKM